jgi:hypothetical protein
MLGPREKFPSVPLSTVLQDKLLITIHLEGQKALPRNIMSVGF